MNTIYQSKGDSSKSSFLCAILVCPVQIPPVICYASGMIPSHPIILMFPLIGLLKFSREKINWENLRLPRVSKGRSFFLAVVYAGLSLLGLLMGLLYAGNSSKFTVLNSKVAQTLIISFMVAVFIIALWAKLVKRGYIQTCLQFAWDFWS